MKMFCPTCGIADQTPESYCRQCGTWLYDPTAKPVRLRFGTTTREEKVTRIRTLELISAALSLTAAAIVFAFLFTGANPGLLFLAAAVSVVVAVYQIANMVLGHGVMKGLPKPPVEQPKAFQRSRDAALPAADTSDLGVPASVTEDTTRHLDKVPTRHDRS